LRISEIYLDLDDCLAIFTPVCFNEMTGLDKELTYDWWLTRWQFNISGAVAETRASLGKEPLPGYFWSHVPRELWANLPKTGICDWLLNAAVSAVGMENVYILTRPTREPSCFAGKADWVRDNLGEFWVDQTILTGHKELLAESYRLLIDDSPRNVDLWLANGGCSIFVPRPWNPAWDFIPSAYIKARWSEYFREPMPEYRCSIG
jgi:hypothetical protein